MQQHKVLMTLLGTLFLAGMAQASSYIRVVNNSSQELQTVLQAGGCLESMVDWNDDRQYTVCGEMIVKPGFTDKFIFGSWLFDRSAKVMTRTGERVGYCNTMNSSSMVFVDDPEKPGGIIFTNNCE